MTVDDKLGTDRFYPADKSHILINEEYWDVRELKRLVMACPAQLYSVDGDGKLKFSYEGCLECGTCRVLGFGKGVRKWNHPEGGMGVEYRMG